MKQSAKKVASISKIYQNISKLGKICIILVVCGHFDIYKCPLAEILSQIAGLMVQLKSLHDQDLL